MYQKWQNVVYVRNCIVLNIFIESIKNGGKKRVLLALLCKCRCNTALESREPGVNPLPCRRRARKDWDMLRGCDSKPVHQLRKWLPTSIPGFGRSGNPMDHPRLLHQTGIKFCRRWKKERKKNMSVTALKQILMGDNGAYFLTQLECNHCLSSVGFCWCCCCC